MDALKEVSIQEPETPWMFDEYRSILDNADRIKKVRESISTEWAYGISPTTRKFSLVFESPHTSVVSRFAVRDATRPLAAVRHGTLGCLFCVLSLAVGRQLFYIYSSIVTCTTCVDAGGRGCAVEKDDAVSASAEEALTCRELFLGTLCQAPDIDLALLMNSTRHLRVVKQNVPPMFCYLEL